VLDQQRLNFLNQSRVIAGIFSQKRRSVRWG
jgi:hypothetical protein